MSRRAYWICQLSGWALYGVINVLLGAPAVQGRALGRWALGTLVLTAVGLAVSHGLRALYRQGRWIDRGALRILPGVLAASAVGGVAILVATVALNTALSLMTRPLAPAEALVLAFNLGATLLIWSGFYFGVHHLERLRQARAVALQAELGARQAQLDLLRSKLNPHFVFNSLNGIRALISEDPARAQEAVTGLATLLRYILAADAQTTVTLGEELAVVEDYLRLEAIRLEERLAVRLDIEPSARDVHLPPMLVQTLVENAIKHGVAVTPQGGTIEVCGRREGAGVRLQIRNPGQPGQPASASPGLGLANARARLRLLYGEGARLALQADGPGVVLTDLYVPALSPDR